LGIVGFCFGGRVTFLVALRQRLGAAGGLFRGGGVAGRLPPVPPLGGRDPALPAPRVRALRGPRPRRPPPGAPRAPCPLAGRPRPDRGRAVPGCGARLPLRSTRRVRRDHRQGRVEPDTGVVRRSPCERPMKDIEDAPTTDCDLCEAARITPWYHEDEVCWIAECEICAVPMVVWRKHGSEPTAADLEHMLDRLGEVAAEQLTVEHYVDDNMRNIPDHFHAHARPRGGFFGHGFRKT